MTFANGSASFQLLSGALRSCPLRAWFRTWAWLAPCVRVELGRLEAQGIGVTVVDPRWVKPLDPALLDLAREHALVAVAEDNGRTGAVGDAVARLLRDAGVDTPIRTFGIPQEFLDHAARGEILTDIGLTPQALARDLTESIAVFTAMPLASGAEAPSFGGQSGDR